MAFRIETLREVVRRGWIWSGYDEQRFQFGLKDLWNDSKRWGLLSLLDASSDICYNTVGSLFQRGGAALGMERLAKLSDEVTEEQHYCYSTAPSLLMHQVKNPHSGLQGTEESCHEISDWWSLSDHCHPLHSSSRLNLLFPPHTRTARLFLKSSLSLESANSINSFSNFRSLLLLLFCFSQNLLLLQWNCTLVHLTRWPSQMFEHNIDDRDAISSNQLESDLLK